MDDPTVVDGDEAPARPKYWANALLFVATVVSVLFTGAANAHAVGEHPSIADVIRALPKGAPFAVPLMAILVAHELAHYVAARLHRVPASLPYFIPFPYFSFMGTMGAVISLPDRIRSRNALFDIGASGPLAGLAVALPIWCIGIATSHVEVLDGPYVQEGQSLAYVALKLVLKGPIPAGSDLSMNALATAGWVGALVTMINLVPVGQLDGGHVAYALFGQKQNGYAVWLHRALLLAFTYNVVRFGSALVASGHYKAWPSVISNSMFWLVWFGLTAGFKRMSGVNHPPTDDDTLSPRRRILGVVCLVVFVLLFMPTPLATMG